MPWTDFLVILAVTAGCTLLSRTVPVLLFAHRDIPPRLLEVLDYIPVAAFAALVANDLFAPSRFSAGLWANLLPLIAIIPVILVARKTKSLWLCIVVGIAAYALLTWLTGFFTV